MSKWFLKEEDLNSRDTFNGSWADFHKDDGDYFVERGGCTWIIRCLGGKDICRIYNGSAYFEFYRGQHPWNESNKYKIQKATQLQSEHLNCLY